MRATENAEPDRASGIGYATPWKVIEVRALADFRLEVGFADGTRGGVDMASFLSRDCGVFMPLQDAALFRRAYLNEGAVTWPGDLDLAPDRMHEELKKAGVYVMK